MSNRVELSIIAPLFNEQEMISVLLRELILTCDKTGKNYEIVLVDDGSKDRTFELLNQAAAQNQKIKIVRLSRNFGHQAAFSAGIDASSGAMIITMDGDLQHPPALIPEFLKVAESGFDIVIGERTANKQNSFFREFVGKLFYKLLTSITNLEFKNVSDFALYDRKVVSILKRLPERERYLRGLVQWVGFKKTYVPYQVAERKFGTPKYTIKRLAGLVMSGITSFSAFPLRLSFWLGSFIFIGSLFFGVYVVIDHIVNPNPLIAGGATLVVLTLFLGSVQLMVMGVVGEYLYKMFNEIKGRPTYIISETKNLDNSQLERTVYGIAPLR